MVLEGTGLALALNFTTTVISSARTNSVITVMRQSRKSWNQMMLSITGVADSCRLNSHGDGCPNFGKRRPAGHQRNAGHR